MRLEGYHAFVPSSINTLGSGLCVCRSCFYTEDLCSPTQFINTGLLVCFGRVPVPTIIGLELRLPTGVYQSSYQAPTKKSLCVQMKIEEGDRDMAGYCWSAPAISTLEVTEDPTSDLSYQSLFLQI